MDQSTKRRSHLSVTITEEYLPMNVKQALSRLLHLSEHQIRSAKYRDNGIMVNGERARVTRCLTAGDFLSVSIQEEETDIKVKRVAGSLDIIYEDEDILAVNKPAGLPVHPGRGHYEDTLSNFVRAYLPGHVRAVGRLDKDTSGVVIFAKGSLSAARLSDQSREDHFKIYRALVRGDMSAGESLPSLWKDIEKPLRQRPGSLNKMEALPEGAEAVNEYRKAHTKIRVLAASPDASLIEAIPVTGRTHQIRVHLAALGHPLLGDPIYGTDPSGEHGEIVRTMLHCREAHLLLPVSGERKVIRAPYPMDFTYSAEQLFPSLPEDLL